MTFSDIKKEHWIIRFAPEWAKPYLILMRADRPIGTWLLLFPCLWSLCLAADQTNLHEITRLGTLFLIGSFVMRGAGCVLNDIADCHLDAMVERTKTRPLPAGEINIFQALMFLALLLLIGFLVLLQFNQFSILIGAASLLLVFPYPLMKRITWWPQAWLGLTFNWGALMGWSAIYGHLDPAPLILYLAGFFWTMGYDTIYAHQDKDDDALIGVKSSARALNTKTKPALYAFYTMMLILVCLAGWLANLSYLFFMMTPVIAMHLFWQVKTLDQGNPKNCLNRFKSNAFLGWLLLLAIIMGQL